MGKGTAGQLGWTRGLHPPKKTAKNPACTYLTRKLHWANIYFGCKVYTLGICCWILFISFMFLGRSKVTKNPNNDPRMSSYQLLLLLLLLVLLHLCSIITYTITLAKCILAKFNKTRCTITRGHNNVALKIEWSFRRTCPLKDYKCHGTLTDRLTDANFFFNYPSKIVKYWS